MNHKLYQFHDLIFELRGPDIVTSENDGSDMRFKIEPHTLKSRDHKLFRMSFEQNCGGKHMASRDNLLYGPNIIRYDAYPSLPVLWLSNRIFSGNP